MLRSLNLAEARKGQFLMMGSVADPAVRLLALRLGLGEGSRVRCLHKLPGGPVILALGLQKIAVGRRLARQIPVRKERV